MRSVKAELHDNKLSSTIISFGPTVDQYLRWAHSHFVNIPLDQRRREARLMLGQILNVDPSTLIAHPEIVLTSTQIKIFQKYIDRRLNHEPLSRILGQREFWSLNFKISPDTLDPRPDSEILIEAVLKDHPDKSTSLSILEFGVGSGCLVLTLLSEFPHSWGVGVDRSLEALKVAQENASLLHLQDRVHFYQGNWGQGLKGYFDVIFSNPPYISPQEIETLDPGVRCYDPRLALEGGQDGLECYRQLAPQIFKLCHQNTRVYLEIGQGQEKEVEKIMGQAGFNHLTWHLDLQGIKRCGVFNLNFEPPHYTMHPLDI